ncbi:hypothetical protein, partial [Gordonia sp. (in: high G+C Gram-positive bacteria)]|uniref:hypothetical protein n=1 Tax=Gordonia sp. (in: high G+C Gram-positive bacteria) TaxID=84139 RepID=UPI0025BCB9C6
AALAGSLRRAAAAVPRVLLTSRRSALTSLVAWDAVATDHASVATVLEGVPGRAALFIEDAPSFAGSPAEAALLALAARATRGECLIVSEAETREWHASYGLLGPLKASRTGLVLAPDTHDGDLIFQTPFARLHRREFPPGRAVWVTSGRPQRVQLPLAPLLLNDTMSGQGAVLR